MSPRLPRSVWPLPAAAAGLLALLVPAAALAQQTSPASEDSQLLKDLQSDLLEDLPAARQPPKEPAAKGTADRSAGDKQLLEDLQAGEDLGSQPENPLLRIGQQMRAVQARMAGRDTSDQTQAAQHDIVSELEKLIEQARQQNNQQNQTASGRGAGKAGVGNGEATPGAPQESTDRVGKPRTETPQTTDVRNLLERIWGHLPDKTRDEMQNALSDQFLPKYERLIEEYYKRLAEERPGARLGGGTGD